MKKTERIIASFLMMALFAFSPAYGEVCKPEIAAPSCDSQAYYDGCCVSDWCTWLPIGALVIAGVIIATSHNRHHYGSSSSCRSTSYSSCCHSGASSSGIYGCSPICLE